MDELIRINFDSDCSTVSGRELHAALEVGTKYADWFKRMCDYGFAEGMDIKLASQIWEARCMGVKTRWI